MKPVSIYTTVTCTYCKMAKEFFQKNNISYQEFDVGTDLEKRQEMIEKSGQMGVPVITIGDTRYVKKQGDTMTGALVINVTGGNQNTLGLRVINTLSGAHLHAEQRLTSSGVLVVESGAYLKGSLVLSTDGSTTSNPRRVGMVNFTSGEAGRFEFGDPLNSLQAAHGGRVQIQSYWGMEIAGNRQSGTPLSFDTGRFSDTSTLTVTNTRSDSVALVLAGASSQSANYLNVTANGGADGGVFVISAAGNVGLGKASPSAKLDVVGTISGSSLTVLGTLYHHYLLLKFQD
jgi:glutaredoxin